MPMPTIEFRYLDQVHSPFSGLPAEFADEGPNQADPSLLFVYYGMASEWGYVSPRFPSDWTRFLDDAEPAEVAESLEIDGAIMLVVDTDWNGVNYYGFAPADSQMKFAGGVVFAEHAVE